MEIRWLEAFIAVAEELHFGNAAIRLRMAKSPLSQVIRKLEHSLGTDLFIRNTRSVELTSAGHAFLPHARMVLEDLELAQQSVKVPDGVVYGHLTLGFTGVLNQRTLPRFTRAVRDTYPEIELSLVGRVMTQDAIAQLDAGRLDLAFVGLPIDSTRTETQLLLRERYGMVVPTEHSLAEQDDVELSMFAEERFITPPIGAGSVLYEDTIRACTNAGFHPIISQQITDPYMSMMLVAAGVGVAYLPEGVQPVVPPGTRFVPLVDEAMHLNHGLAWSKLRSSPAREAFLGLVEDVLAEGL
jgi:DNA-binding transcriptional LysR family regulator